MMGIFPILGKFMMEKIKISRKMVEFFPTCDEKNSAKKAKPKIPKMVKMVIWVSFLS